MAKKIRYLCIYIIILLGIMLVFKYIYKSKNPDEDNIILIGGIDTRLYYMYGTVLGIDSNLGTLQVELETDSDLCNFFNEQGLFNLNDQFFSKKEVVLEYSNNKISEMDLKEGDYISFAFFLFDIKDDSVKIEEINFPAAGCEEADP